MPIFFLEKPRFPALFKNLYTKFISSESDQSILFLSHKHGAKNVYRNELKKANNNIKTRKGAANIIKNKHTRKDTQIGNLETSKLPAIVFSELKPEGDLISSHYMD